MISDSIASAFPVTWPMERLGNLAWVRARLGWKGLTADEYVDSGIPMLATPNIKSLDIDFAGANRITAERYEESPEIKLRVGDVLLTKDGSTIGIANVVRALPEPATVNGSIAVLTPNERLDSCFLFWLVKSNEYQALMRSWQDGMGVPHLFQSDIRRIPVPVPTRPVQRAIADYLNRETAEIDVLIAKNEELIALLAERRAAVIREGTGVGLDANAELIDSGLDDVGMIPAGWRVMRLSWLFRNTGSGTTPPSELMLDGEEADVWWVTTGELRERIIESTNRGVSADTLVATSALKIHPAGSLLIAMYGATIGRMGVLGVPAASNQAVCALSGPVDCSVEFVEYAMLAARERLVLAAVGGGQPNINQETVRAFRIPVPDLTEQRQIVQHLRSRVGEIDRATETAERGIQLARERRAALISAAVTGRIDVPITRTPAGSS